MTDDHRTKEIRAADRKAEAIARVLLARGLPVLSATSMDAGAKIGIAFQLENERARYGVRCPTDEASPEWFEEAFRVVA